MKWFHMAPNVPTTEAINRLWK